MVVPPSPLSPPQARWVDIDGDGRLDVLATRASRTWFGYDGALVWLRQPADPLKVWLPRTFEFCCQKKSIFRTQHTLYFGQSIVLWALWCFLRVGVAHNNKIIK